MFSLRNKKELSLNYFLNPSIFGALLADRFVQPLSYVLLNSVPDKERYEEEFWNTVDCHYFEDQEPL